MKTNPILYFRYSQEQKILLDENNNLIESRKVDSEKQATMITKTREAIDCSEISMIHEEVQDSIHFE